MIKRTKKVLGELGRLTPLAAISAIMPIAGSTVLLLVAYPLGEWLQENWQIGSVLFIAGILIFCGLALLPTNVVGIISGWAFSFDLGLLVLMTGIVGSSFISFLINSRISRGRLPELAEKHAKAEAIYNALTREGFWRTTLIVFLLRMSIIMPFALTNFLMAAARVPVRAFLIGTAAGMLPRSSAMVFVGSGLSRLDFQNAGESWSLILGIIASLISIIAIGYISKQALDRLTTDPEGIGLMPDKTK